MHNWALNQLSVCRSQAGRAEGRIKDGRGEQEREGGGDEQLRARRFLCILWYCRPSNIYSTNCLMRSCVRMRARFQRPPQRMTCVRWALIARFPSSCSTTWLREEEASLCKQPVVAGALLTNVTRALWIGDDIITSCSFYEMGLKVEQRKKGANTPADFGLKFAGLGSHFYQFTC